MLQVLLTRGGIPDVLSKNPPVKPVRWQGTPGRGRKWRPETVAAAYAMDSHSRRNAVDDYDGIAPGYCVPWHITLTAPGCPERAPCDEQRREPVGSRPTGVREDRTRLRILHKFS